MNPISYKVPRSIRGLVDTVTALFPTGKNPGRGDRYPHEARNETPPRRNKPTLTTRGHFIDCIA